MIALPQRQEMIADIVHARTHGARLAPACAELGLSVRSVGNHLAKIYNKLHIHGRSEAVLYAIRTGIAAVE